MCRNAQVDRPSDCTSGGHSSLSTVVVVVVGVVVVVYEVVCVVVSVGGFEVVVVGCVRARRSQSAAEVQERQLRRGEF